MTVKVFLVDDHEVVRRGLRELLEAEPGFEIVGEAGLAREAERRAPALRPDVVVLDARLPDGSGVDVCRHVRSVDPSVKVLILTSYDDESALMAAVLAGASGFLLKDIRGNGLVEAVQRVAAGEHLLDDERVESLRARWTDHGAKADPRLKYLSPQERRILDRVAAGLTNRQIGDALSLSEKTVKNYVTSMLAKLGMERRTQAAVYAVTHEPDRGGNAQPGSRPPGTVRPDA